MNIFRKIFNRRKENITIDYGEFWSWFTRNEKGFYSIVKKGAEVDSKFLSRLMPQLQKVNPQFYCVTGMIDETTVGRRKIY